MSFQHLLSLPRWLLVAIVVVVALIGVQELFGRTDAARADAGPCTFSSVDYTYGYASSLDERGVVGAELSGVAPVCAGRSIRLTFIAADGSPLAAASTRAQSPRTVLELSATEAITTDSIDRFEVVFDR